MLKLYYRRGGTANFTWLAVIAREADFAAKAAELARAGYPSVVAEAAPTTFDGSPAPTPPAPAKRLTLKAASEQLPVGMVMKRTGEGDEVRVNYRGAPEATAYYTDDLQDAIDTARHMIRELDERPALAGRLRASHRVCQTD